MEVSVLPLECVLHAVKTLLALPVGKSNEPNSLLSLCVTLGIQARSISKNRGKSPLVCGILAHQCEKHQYRMHLPVNTRIDLLTPTQHARAAEEVHRKRTVRPSVATICLVCESSSRSALMPCVLMSSNATLGSVVDTRLPIVWACPTLISARPCV
jgi:hypothetical protein